jgi:hypothetical protein
MEEKTVQQAESTFVVPPRVHWDDPSWPAGLPSMERQGRALEAAVAEVWEHLPLGSRFIVAAQSGCIHVVPLAGKGKDPSWTWGSCENALMVITVPMSPTPEPDLSTASLMPLVVRLLGILLTTSAVPCREWPPDKDWGGLRVTCGEVLLMTTLETSNVEELLTASLAEMGRHVTSSAVSCAVAANSPARLLDRLGLLGTWAPTPHNSRFVLLPLPGARTPWLSVKTASQAGCPLDRERPAVAGMRSYPCYGGGCTTSAGSGVRPRSRRRPCPPGRGRRLPAAEKRGERRTHRIQAP